MLVCYLCICFHLYPAVFSHFQEYMVTSINMTAFYVTCTHFSIKHKKKCLYVCVEMHTHIVHMSVYAYMYLYALSISSIRKRTV